MQELVFLQKMYQFYGTTISDFFVPTTQKMKFPLRTSSVN